MATLAYASPLVFITLTPIASTDNAQLARAIDAIMAHDDRLRVVRDPDALSVELGGTDDEHLEDVIDTLKRKFSVAAGTSRVRVDTRREAVASPDGVQWVVTEPWMDVGIQTRAFYVPRLCRSWPRLQVATTDGGNDQRVTLNCRTPLAEMFGLRGAVRDMTHGEAEVSVAFAGYAPRDDDDGPAARVPVRR